MKKVTNLCGNDLGPDEVRRCFAMITGKWKLEILWLLNQRVHRFGELRRAIPGITQHMLTAQLRELEADGLVSREAFAEIPPRVEYALTSASLDLAPVMESILRWFQNHPRSRPIEQAKNNRKGNGPVD